MSPNCENKMINNRNETKNACGNQSRIKSKSRLQNVNRDSNSKSEKENGNENCFGQSFLQ